MVAVSKEKLHGLFGSVILLEVTGIESLTIGGLSELGVSLRQQVLPAPLVLMLLPLRMLVKVGLSLKTTTSTWKEGWETRVRMMQCVR